MIFHSLTFLLFFLIFIIGFIFLKKNNARIIYTLLASYIFYAWWYPPYLVLLIGFTIYAYIAGKIIKGNRHFIAIVTLGVLPLCFFKYWNFIVINLNYYFHPANEIPMHHWGLPLGISFITFTVLAYIIDIYRGVSESSNSFRSVALYLSFFPHLIAGPIMRPNELLPQFTHLQVKPKYVKFGLLLFAVGMVKKIVFADQLAPLVDRIYSQSSHLNVVESALAFYAFPVQIYCDFSGYTDMALGLAFMLGIRLPINFNRPYVAQSIREFWHRWHMTLSRWLRDYLYIPLGGNKFGVKRTVLALMLTMTIGGLWHGAAWTFVLWGAYHGFLLIIGFLTRKISIAKNLVINGFAKNIYTFHAVTVGWVLFRGRNWNEVAHIFSGFQFPYSGDVFAIATFPVILIAIFFILHSWDRVSFFYWISRRQRGAVIYGVATVLILISAVLSVGNPNAFIYFDF